MRGTGSGDVEIERGAHLLNMGTSSHEAPDTIAPRTLLGSSIPDTAHAVSVSLPTWRANVGYEEGHDWVVGKMKSGYPRFFVHPSIQGLAEALLEQYGESGQSAFLFPVADIAQQCLQFAKERFEPQADPRGKFSPQPFRSIEMTLQHNGDNPSSDWCDDTILAVAVLPYSCIIHAKTFWQHSGEGISSRRAEFLHHALLNGHLVPRRSSCHNENSDVGNKGPRRYQKGVVNKKTKSAREPSSAPERIDYSQFIEERFGRNLDPSLSSQAKHAIRRRISSCVNQSAQRRHRDAAVRTEQSVAIQPLLAEHDVYLYPSGMSAIFNSHRLLKKTRGRLRSVMFGFPYIDTLKILEKFGPKPLFYGNGSQEDLDDLERRSSRGEKFLAVYCEFPGNPLLITPNLRRIRQLGAKYGFAVVVDDTIGNFLNVDVLPAADIVVTSLTKVFSGDSNVMGGSLTLNPESECYNELKAAMDTEYEDNYWPEDAIFMERNSRDFISRNERININADAICLMLRTSSLVKKVYYPKYASSRQYFDEYKNPDGGYGGLFSVTFNASIDAHYFFDALETEKGPSLGTNFTLSCPFVILAHYNELDWASQFGVEPDLVRVSVGLEDTARLVDIFQRALDRIPKDG